MAKNNQTEEIKLLYCSFCGKSQNDVKKLVAASDSPAPVNICEECIELSREIVSDVTIKELNEKVRKGSLRKCSFCEKFEHEVKKIVSGPQGAICNECVDLTSEIIGDEDEEAGIRIRRSIEFAPEQKQAGMAILSYFSRIIEQKYPDENVSIRIEQEGAVVTLIIQTTTGIAERIRHTLDEYGKVVMGVVAPEHFLNDPMQIIELKSKLEMTALELRLTKELHSTTKQLQDQRVTTLEDRVKELHSYIGSGISHVHQLHELLGVLIRAKPNNVEVIEATNQLIEIVQKGISKEDENPIKIALETLASKDKNLFENVLDVLTNTIGGTSGSLLTSWIGSIACSFPK
jgi:hypothetical protein